MSSELRIALRFEKYFLLQTTNMLLDTAKVGCRTAVAFHHDSRFSFLERGC